MQADQPHALYRFFGGGGTLLYIGMTADLPGRITNHREEKAWWLGVTKVTVEHYSDRTSVLEAERRAIIAERPLYNIQHNRPAGVPTARPTAARDQLTFLCVGCQTNVNGSRRATIHVRTADAFNALHAQREWNKKHEPSPDQAFHFLSGTDLFSYPGPARWAVHCDDCNPHKNEYGEMCGDCYWFSLDRCRTATDMLRWTAHLLGKNWFAATDWDQFIYRSTPAAVEP